MPDTADNVSETESIEKWDFMNRRASIRVVFSTRGPTTTQLTKISHSFWHNIAKKRYSWKKFQNFESQN